MAALAIVQPHTLAARLQEVEAIASTLEALDSTDELSTEEYTALQAHLSTCIAGTRDKIDTIAYVLADFEAGAAAAAREIERLAARKARFERHGERLRTHVLFALAEHDVPRLEGYTSTLSRRLNPPKVVIEDEAALPSTFFRYPAPPPPAPDKTAIAAELKRGIDVPGARLARSERLVVS